MDSATLSRRQAESNEARQTDRLMTETQAAAYLGIRPQTLTCWRCTRRYAIPFIRVGSSIRYRFSAVEKWLEKRTEKPTARG